MKRHGMQALAAALLLGLAGISRAGTTAEEDWRAVQALDAGPQARPKTAPEARQVTLQFLATQERAYRAFLEKWPDDPRAVDAQLRLAQLLAVKADFTVQPKDREEGRALLARLAARPDLPPERRADVQFAQLTFGMRGLKTLDADTRSALLGQIREFQKAWPSDRRLAALLAEVASLYDDQPEQKRLILNEALALAHDERLRARIADDLHRIAQLGSPVALQFKSIQGAPVDVATLRGKVVVIVFFATWSAPSLAALDALPDWPADKVAVLAVSVDREVAALQKAIETVKFTAPVACDGLGWESPLVRRFGINALPTIWVLDKQGRLRTLNAKAPEAVVRDLLGER